MIRTATLQTKIGLLTLTAERGSVVGIEFGGAGAGAPQGSLLAQATRELREYLAGDRTEFDFPFRLPEPSTPFQRRVCEALRRIPRGETRTYGALARELGTSPRAVGGACSRNPLPLVIPCHRVVAAASIGGFSGSRGAGPALDIKRQLLEIEGVVTHWTQQGPPRWRPLLRKEEEDEEAEDDLSA